MAHPILPKRPFQLRPDFVSSMRVTAALFILAGGAIFAGCVTWQTREIVSILRDGRTWARGVPAVDGRVKYSASNTRTIGYEFDVDVLYLDASGASHTGSTAFVSVLSGPNTDVRPSIRYDPDAPDRFALSWSQDVEGGRWAGVVMVLLFGVGLAALLLRMGRTRRRALADATRCAERCEEIHVALTKAVVDARGRMAAVDREYHYRLDLPGGATHEGLLTFPLRTGPLFTDEGCTELVALVCPEAPTRPVFLRSDFYPFDLTAAQRAAVAQRQAAALAVTPVAPEG